MTTSFQFRTDRPKPKSKTLPPERVEQRIAAIQALIGAFFEKYPDVPGERNIRKALPLLRGCDEFRNGVPEGWAAGLVYAFSNWRTFPCGVPGVSREEFEKFFRTSMSTARKRANYIAETFWFE